jgi:hypothetical protein
LTAILTIRTASAKSSSPFVQLQPATPSRNVVRLRNRLSAAKNDAQGTHVFILQDQLFELTLADWELMRIIDYKRHELHGNPVEKRAKISTFVYDIPYFGACGIFPPLHILNQIFETGGSEGGMSPGTTWDPFTITEEEYGRLVDIIARLDPKTLDDKARYTFIKFEFDADFDHLQDWDAWIRGVCKKHRDAYHSRRSGN